MKRLLHVVILTVMLLAAGLPALAQVGAQRTPDGSEAKEAPEAQGAAEAPEAPQADAPQADGAEAPPSPVPAAAPWVEASWLLATGRETVPAEVREAQLTAAVAAPQPAAPEAPTLGGDWSNAAAWGCITPLGIAHNAAFGAGLAAAPPFDYYPAVAEYIANLGLKLCAPVVYPPGDFVQGHNVDASGQCGFTFNQPRLEGQYKNFMGIALPWGDVFPGKDWGDFGQPAVVHWNTTVDVSLRVPHATDLGRDDYRLPVGVHTLTWRGDTLISLLDGVPRYIPGWAWTRMNKLFQLRGVSEIAAETTLETVIDLAAGELAFIPSSPTMYNEEVQRLAVTDQTRPWLSGPPTVQIEAIEPGGVSQRTYLYLLRRTLSVSDNCDAAPDVFPEEAGALPDFVAVGGGDTVTWYAEDNGPQDLSGAPNRSQPLTQQFVVADTLAPIIVPPPDIVTETTSLPAAVNLGHPGTFDLADLNPTVSHNACSLPGVICESDVIRFPAGKTTVTWTAVDHAGNTDSTSQYVNVKSVGDNNAPTAESGAGGDAISYEPITLTLQANDPDGDRLWFQIEDQPDDGFFHAPLYPYFIQDYRLANVEEIDFGEYCSQEENRGEYVPTNWPVNARFMAVDDEGNVYVQDEGIVRCLSHEDGATRDYRLAIFRPDGTWDEVASSFDVKDMVVDLRNEILYTSQHDVGGSFSLVRVFDLDLNPIVTYRTDNGGQPFREPKNVAIDTERDLLYVTDGFQYIGSATLWVMHLPPAGEPGVYVEPEFRAEYQAPDAYTWQDLALDSEGNLYASDRDSDRIYKWTAATVGPDGAFTPGDLVGWMGRCDSGPGCDIANGRSFGFSCTDETCTAPTTSGSGPGQFDFPRAIAFDNNDILYVTDYNNQRVQRFTPDGYFAGQAISECDGSCFVLGDFGKPKQVTVNSSHFYVLDDDADLLHVFETTPLTRITDESAEIVYQSDNNFVGTDTFTFRVSDGLDESAPAPVSIDVSRNYRPPVTIGPLAVSTEEDVRVQVPVDGYDPDEPLDTLSYETVERPANGLLVREGASYYYEPDPDFAGIDTFTYAASDGVFLSEGQTVTVTVTPVNDPPRFPEGVDPNRPAGFALRTAGAFSGLGRLAPLGTADDPMRVGRGFNTAFSITFEDPDNEDVNMVTVDWGDGSPVEAEGELLEDGTMTGPVLSEGVTGGTGSATAEHVFSSSGEYTVEFCISDNVAVDGDGNKSLTPASTTSCLPLAVSVAPMVDLLVDIRPTANPYPVGAPFGYDLVVTNHAPDNGSGLTATGIELTENLDTRLTAANASSDGGDCDADGSTVTCTLDPLAPGESATIHVDVQVPASIEPGMVLANHVGYSLDQENQADVQENGDLVTVVAPADYVVNAIADSADGTSGDATPGDDVCATEEGACTLRAAVEEANEHGGARTISLADWQIILAAELPVSGNVTITGLGADQTVVAGNGESRLFNVAEGGTLTLTALTLQGGSTAGDGGALYNAGTATLTAVQLSGNHADGRGGAIYNEGALSAYGSAITGNDAAGGAGGVENDGTLVLQNVTVSGNRGAVGGLTGGGSATLENVTVARNRATGDGGGLSGSAATLMLHNTIVALNTAEGASPDCAGGFTSQGHNLLGDPAGCTIAGASNDVIGQDARLAPLHLNDAGTLSHEPRGGSPAIDAGTCNLSLDQGGVARPVDGDLDGSAACDIGAVEFTPLRMMLPVVGR